MRPPSQWRANKIADAEARQKLSEATYQRQLSAAEDQRNEPATGRRGAEGEQSAAAGVQIAIRERELAEAQLSEARVNRLLCDDHGADLGRHRLGDDAGGRNGRRRPERADLRRDRRSRPAPGERLRRRSGHRQGRDRPARHVQRRCLPGAGFHRQRRRDLSERHHPGQRRQIRRRDRHRRRGPRPACVPR